MESEIGEMMQRMKVVHLVGGELSGGAARGAYWLHKGLIELGVDSSIITNAKSPTSDPTVVSLAADRLGKAKVIVRNRCDSVLTSLCRRKDGPIFSAGLFGGRVSDHPLVRSADVVNLHWVARGPLGLSDMRRLQMPVVWTMRDMWPFTGGCHISMDCDRYTSVCGRCPQLGSSRATDLSSVLARQKRRALPPRMVAVGISSWLSEQAQRSSILGQREIRTISNCIDCDLFTPMEKAAARATLGLRVDKRIVLVGSTSLKVSYKGTDLFVKAMSKLPHDDYLVLSFGNDGGALREKLKQEVRSLGYLTDDLSLRIAYSAADVFVAPSIMEPFGKTIVESMACGTPVVCFDATGPKDIVEHKVTGYKASPFSVEDLAGGIRYVACLGEEGQLGQAARRSALGRFDKSVVASCYVDLYKEVIEKFASKIRTKDA